MAERHTILFIAEAVTLAHVARPLVLAQALDAEYYDLTLACDQPYQSFVDAAGIRTTTIESVSSEIFLDKLARGKPLYDFQTLQDYVREDLALIARIKPDLIIGDFRLSLSVSARVAGIPYITISNAYWSPYGRQKFPLPELPVNKMVGLAVASAVFKIIRPLAFAIHALPLNRLHREHQLPGPGFDLRRAYTAADYTLYSDIPELMPTYDLPASHHYLGALLWSPPCELPDWWNRIPAGRPLIYINLGSSGCSERLPAMLAMFADMPVFVMAATAGRVNLETIHTNAFVAEYLPGVEAAARASLVICNGGSLATQQALTAGIPVLGIISNMDQHMNMLPICQAGAGRLYRQSELDMQGLRAAVQDMLATEGYRHAAGRLAGFFANYDAQSRFQALVSNIVGQNS